MPTATQAPATAAIATLATGTQSARPALTLGSFFPPIFLPIQEENEAAFEKGNDELEVGLSNRLPNESAAEFHATRRLQFSDMEVSTNPTPSIAEVVRGNRCANLGKPLKFIPPISVDGKTLVYLSDDDVKPQIEYWGNALIGYVVGENPFASSMEQYVKIV